MNQIAFVALTASVAFGMFLFGWIAGVFLHRLRKGSASDSEAMGRLLRDLAIAEHQRDQYAQQLSELEDQRDRELAERDELYRQTIDRLRDAEMRLIQLDRSE